jgi:hypothetical protein
MDKPNQRKSFTYASAEVEAGRADWIDPAVPAKGILCRAFLYSGQQLYAAAPEAISKLARPRRCPLPPLEVECTHFDDPQASETTRRERMRLILSARAIAYFDTPLDLVQQL